MKQRSGDGYALIQHRLLVRRQNVKGRGSDAMLSRPVSHPVKYRRIIVIHSEDGTCDDHDADNVKSADGRSVIATEILCRVLFTQDSHSKRLKICKEATQNG